MKPKILRRKVPRSRAFETEPLPPMSLLAVRDVHKGYEGVDLLRGVSLSLDVGARVGLVGRNASGKSTLLRILSGVEEPDGGERVARRGLRMGVLTQAPVMPADRSVRDVVRSGLAGREQAALELEQLYAELGDPRLEQARMEALLTRQTQLEAVLEAQGGHDVEHRVDELIARLGLLEPDALCGRLSGGERRRVDLARLLLDAPDVMLLDEPTNHLDAVVIDWLEDFLSSSRVPLLMVTHDRYFLDRVVDRIVELDRGELHTYEGGYADYLVQREARLSAEGAAESARQNLLRRETAWMLRGAPARTTKARARIDRYHELVGAEREEVGPSAELAIPPGPRLGQRVLHLKAVTKRFGERLIVPPLDLELLPGERLGIIGPNGAGKSTVLGIATGRIVPDAGSVAIGETVQFSMIDQLRDSLDPNATVVQEVAGASEHVLYAGRPVRVESFLDRLLFPGARKHTEIRKLSGGEQNRVLLAKLLIQGGNVLILDEPTNDLDLDTLRILEETLLAFPGSLIVVSHDRYFLDRVATRILYLDGEGHARHHYGPVSSLLERLSLERLAGSATSSSTNRPQSRPAASAKPDKGAAPKAGVSASTKKAGAPAAAAAAAKGRRLAPWEQRELEQLTGRLEQAEAKLAKLDARLCDPDLYHEPAAVQAQVRGDREQAAAQVATLYARWEELEPPTP